MILNKVDWQTTGTDYLYKHPTKKKYLTRIAYKHNGKRKFVTEQHKDTDFRIVKKLHAQLVAKAQSTTVPLQAQKVIKAKQVTDTRNITPDKTIESCINILERDSTPAIKNQIGAFRKHVKPLHLYSTPLKDIKFSDLQDLKKVLTDKELKTPTYTAVRSLITKAFNRAELFNQFQHFTIANPFESDIQSKTTLIEHIEEYAPKKLTALQMAKAVYKEIVTIDDIDTQRTVLLAFLLSKRINEIKSIKRSDIDLSTNTVMITISKRRATGRPQEFPLPKEVIPLLEVLKPNEYISSRRSVANRPYSPTAKSIISNVTGIELKDLKQYAIHDVRSIALQTLIDSGYDEVKAERVLLDHATGRVSGHYKATTLTERKSVYNTYWDLIRPSQLTKPHS